MNEQTVAAPRTGFDLAGALSALREGRPLAFAGISVHSSVIHSRRFTFAVDRKRDPIQREHRRGRFYEEEELQLIKAHFPLGGVFVDIGSNVGNHGLFVAGFLSPSRIIPFEPNPVALKLLLANIVMNDFTGVFDLDHLGVGVSDRASGGFAIEDRDRNLGAARMQEGQGELQVVRGDDALADVLPDFIKIDIEGMEMRALKGLAGTIERARPVMMVEVDRENDGAFHEFVDAAGYETISRTGQFRKYKNYVIRPLDRPAEETA